MTFSRQHATPLLLISLLPWVAFHLSVDCAFADTPQILSLRHDSTSAPFAADGHSVAPKVSADGQFVLFSSSANDLVTNDNGYFGLDVFLHDWSSNTTVLVSVNWSGSGGGNGNSVGLQASDNGRHVLFTSDATDLIAGDTNDATDVFIRDLEAGATALASEAADGGWGNGASSDAVMTPDGKWVAFVSAANNLVPDDTNGIPDLFLRDVLGGTTTLLSRGATGTTAMVSSLVITPDGRYVAFFSTAKGMVEAVPASSRGEIYLYDAVTEQFTWVSTNAAATAQSWLNLINMPSVHPAISDDGRYVAFKTGWTNGITISQGTAATLVFVYDSDSGTTTMISTSGFPPWVRSDDVYGPVISADGRYVAFVEREPDQTNRASRVSVFDRETGTNTVASVDQNGAVPTNSISHSPLLSGDGRFLTFLSDATNLVSNAVSNGFHIYRRDLLALTNMLVDANTAGIGSDDQFGVVPAMSADGSTVVFSTLDGELVPVDDNKALDVFAWDASTGTNTLVSRRDPSALSTTGNGPGTLGRMSISGDGGRVTFASFSRDLVTNDFNGESDVLVHDLIGSGNILVSVGLDGNAGLGGGSFEPSISSDGRYVVFLSWATNLVAGDSDSSSDVFRRDLLTGTTVLVSTNANGVNTFGLDCSAPVASDDGRFVAFIGYTNSFTSSRAVLWRDMSAGSQRVVSVNPHGMRPLSMSSDGQRLAYFDESSKLYVWDAQTNSTIVSIDGPDQTSAALVPNGNRLIRTASGWLFVNDLLGLTSSQPLNPASVALDGSWQWSGDGRYVAFVSTNSLVLGDNNGAQDVYLRDLQTGTLTLLSVNQWGTAAADGASDSPVFSADGRFVAFRSFATDVAPGVATPPSLVLFDRVTGANSLIATGTAGAGLTSWLAHPVLSADGMTAAFQSWDEGVVERDLNRAGDVFATGVEAPPSTDSDGDGIPDWWTEQHFGHPTGQADDLSRAEDDADFDGLTNEQEWIVGTDPHDPDSRLALEINPGHSPGRATLTWGARPGRNYQVQSITDLAAPVWELFPGDVSVVGNRGRLDAHATESEQFFRVVGGE